MKIVIDIPNSLYANLSKITNGSIAGKRVLDCVKNGTLLDEELNKTYGVKVINRGNCMLCGKKLTEGLLFCKECEAKGKMKNDSDAQFHCKDCERYNLCKYYHNRKETSYICKYFHLRLGHWVSDDECNEHGHCSECGYGSVDLVTGPHNYCRDCGAKMVEPQKLWCKNGKTTGKEINDGLL